MTDRVNAITVVLEHDVRTDDLEAITSAISMVRGVLHVTAHVADVTDHIAYVRARTDLESKLFNALKKG